MACDVRFAPPGQAQVFRGFLRAGDDPRLVIGRQAQRLGLVKLRVSEGGHPFDRIQSPLGNPRLFDVKHIRFDQPHLLREITPGPSHPNRLPRFFGFFIVLPERSQFVSGTQPRDQSRDLLFGQSSDAGHEPPLVFIGTEVLIHEDAVVLIPGRLLEGKGDQVSEAALRQGVLIGEKAVVRFEGQFMPSAHGTGQESRTELPRQACGKGIHKEEPGMRPVSGTGTLQGHGDAESVADFPERGAVPLPALLVKINGQKVAQIVPAQGVEAGDNTSPQMRLDDLFVQGIVGLMPAVETFDRRFPAEARFPFVPANRRISRPALPVLPSLGVHILPPLEQRHEQPDLLRRIELGWDSRRWFYLRQIPVPHTPRADGFPDLEADSVATGR